MFSMNILMHIFKLEQYDLLYINFGLFLLVYCSRALPPKIKGHVAKHGLLLSDLKRRA